MNWSQLFTSSIGKKLVMALTGIFLVVFLLVHCYINANVLFTNAEENFNRAAHFMGSNILIRIMEIGLFLGFILHILQGYKLELQNRATRKSRYAVSAGNKTSKWYSRSMALLYCFSSYTLYIFGCLHVLVDSQKWSTMENPIIIFMHKCRTFLQSPGL